MCYAYPGPRCSRHVKNDMKKFSKNMENAKAKALEAVSESSNGNMSSEEFTAYQEKADPHWNEYKKYRNLYSEARSQYKETPEGIKSMGELAVSRGVSRNEMREIDKKVKNHEEVDLQDYTKESEHEKAFLIDNYVQAKAKRRDKLERYDKEAKFDKKGYNKEGYNRQGYDKEGYDKEGRNHMGLDREEASQFGWSGIHKGTKTPYDYQGYDSTGHDANGYDKRLFTRNGTNKLTGHLYDKNGLDKRGFNTKFRHHSTGKKYDPQGYNAFGMDKHGYDRNGFDSNGYNRDGYPQKDFSFQRSEKTTKDHTLYDNNNNVIIVPPKPQQPPRVGNRERSHS